MLRPIGYSVALIGVIGAAAWLVAHHLVTDEARARSVQHELDTLQSDVEELRARVDEPPTAAAPPKRPSEPDAEAVYAVPVGDAPARGPTDALVTVVAFTDYQCPFCGRAEATLDELRQRYPEDVRVVVHDLPLTFHAKAFDAAVATECAGEQGLYWPLHDRLFARQRELSIATAPSVLALGLEGLQWSTFERCTQSERPRARVTEDQRLAERFGARGTPSFFINGRVLVGAQPIARFVEVVDRELAAARASGIPRAEYYRRAVLESGRPGV
jgi:protein-disulfide isomerase